MNIFLGWRIADSPSLDSWVVTECQFLETGFARELGRDSNLGGKFINAADAMLWGKHLMEWYALGGQLIEGEEDVSIRRPMPLSLCPVGEYRSISNR